MARTDLRRDFAGNCYVFRVFVPEHAGGEAVSAAVPSHLCTFMLERISTHEALQAVLLLAAYPDQVVTAESLAFALCVSDVTLMEAALHSLFNAELVMRVGSDGTHFQYAPRTRELDDAVQLLTRLYVTHQPEVLWVMAHNAVERVRSSAGQVFAQVSR